MLHIPLPLPKPPAMRAPVHPKQSQRHSVRIVVIKPPMLQKVGGEKTRQTLPATSSTTELATIASPPPSLSAVPQTSISGIPVPPASVQQIPVTPIRDPAVPVNHAQVYQTRTNQLPINSDLMTQPAVRHTRI